MVRKDCIHQEDCVRHASVEKNGILEASGHSSNCNSCVETWKMALRWMVVGYVEDAIAWYVIHDGLLMYVMHEVSPEFVFKWRKYCFNSVAWVCRCVKWWPSYGLGM